MWSGRFKKPINDAVNDFNSSLPFDSRMYAEDISGSLAHCHMLNKQGILSDIDADLIEKGLKGILTDIENKKLTFDSSAEDIHMFIEEELTKRIGDAGKRLHTARSRNDQVALDQRLYAIKASIEIRSLVMDLHRVIIVRARENLNTYMPGYTHLQRAQPITFAHHLTAYVCMLERDMCRIDDAIRRASVSPLGSGSMAGTTYPLDREYVAMELDLTGVTRNSMDGVADRDFAIELVSALAILIMHLSRFSEDIILWASQEFGFIEIDDSYSTGSSIMPQKKNPDVAELTRGKSGRVFGDLISLLVVMKGLPMTYNKDIQEVQESLFDALDTLRVVLPPFTGMIKTLKLNKEIMLEAAKGGFSNATDLADYLVRKGLPFRDAHEVSGKLVRYCIENSKALEELDLSKFQSFSQLIEKDIYDSLSIQSCVENRNIIGSPSPAMVEKELKQMEHFR
ncbi:MAG: argininosuccinate lyase [Clostridiales bacterium]|nr:argininosuccinate lyase [Clostridiales bacterium]